MSDDMRIESLTTTADSIGAAVVKGLLEAEGIPVLLRAYQSAGWLFPGTPGCLGAMEVLVPAGRLAEARRILAAAEAHGSAADDGGACGDAGCENGVGHDDDAGRYEIGGREADADGGPGGRAGGRDAGVPVDRDEG